jgi:hypothetical protein
MQQAPRLTAVILSRSAGSPREAAPLRALKAEWIWGVLDELEKAGVVALADSGYQGAAHAHLPYEKRKGGKLLDSE